MNFVCFASAYWHDPLWTNKQHIMSRFAARGHRVLYVPPGTSKPLARAWLRREAPFSSLWRWVRPERHNLWRMVPLPLPLRQIEPLKPLSWRLLARAVRSFLARRGWQRPILWIYHPEAARVIAGCLDSDTPRAKAARLALARANTWDKRVGTLLALVERRLGETADT